MLDDPDVTAEAGAELAKCLHQFRRLNRFAGGTTTVIQHVAALLSRRPQHVGSDPVQGTRLLDVGTGAADTPVALYHWAGRAGIQLHVTGLDESPYMLEEARRIVGDYPIELTQGDARDLPWPADSFDIATCLGVLHHFNEKDACQVLREMWRVARVGIVVVDLQRSYPLYLGAWLATHTIVNHRFHRHDGPISVLRSFTASELRALGRAAELDGATVCNHRVFLQALVARRA